MIIRNFRKCSDAVKCQLFQSFCTNFSLHLWYSYNIWNLDHDELSASVSFDYYEEAWEISKSRCNKGLQKDLDPTTLEGCIYNRFVLYFDGSATRGKNVREFFKQGSQFFYSYC